MQIIVVNAKAKSIPAPPEYEEEVYISKELYDKYRDYILDINVKPTIFRGREVNEEADVFFISLETEEEIVNYEYRLYERSFLYEALQEKCRKVGVDLDLETRTCREYYNKKIDEAIMQRKYKYREHR